MQVSKKRKAFSVFILHLWNVAKILNTLTKEVTLIADVFQKLRIPKNFVR